VHQRLGDRELLPVALGRVFDPRTKNEPETLGQLPPVTPVLYLAVRREEVEHLLASHLLVEADVAG
jgi:hypothetical protein